MRQIEKIIIFWYLLNMFFFFAYKHVIIDFFLVIVPANCSISQLRLYMTSEVMV